MSTDSLRVNEWISSSYSFCNTNKWRMKSAVAARISGGGRDFAQMASFAGYISQTSAAADGVCILFVMTIDGVAQTLFVCPSSSDVGATNTQRHLVRRIGLSVHAGAGAKREIHFYIKLKQSSGSVCTLCFRKCLFLLFFFSFLQLTFFYLLNT